MIKNNYQILAEKWFVRANDDLLFAQVGFKETGIVRDTCLLSQQAAEKSLKGYLVSQGIEPKRTHNLPALLKECVKIDQSFTEIDEESKFLTRFYEPARYPNAVIELDFPKKSGEKALQAAEKIINFIKNKL